MKNNEIIIKNIAVSNCIKRVHEKLFNNNDEIKEIIISLQLIGLDLNKKKY